MNPEQKQRLIDLHRKYVSAVEGKEREKNELKKGNSESSRCNYSTGIDSGSCQKYSGKNP
jgi:hypothetical protein